VAGPPAVERAKLKQFGLSNCVQGQPPERKEELVLIEIAHLEQPYDGQVGPGLVSLCPPVSCSPLVVSNKLARCSRSDSVE